MSNKQSPLSGKLFTLKEWLTVPEAARHLSGMFGEEVSEADVLRLALDEHLTLSVYFVNHAYVRRGKYVSYDEAEWYPPGFFSNLPGMSEKDNEKCQVMKSLNVDDERFINLDDKVTSISGVWDLPMIGNEWVDIEHQYQMLTGGPGVNLQGLDGSFVDREGGQVCQLQERYDNNEFINGSAAQLEKIKQIIITDGLGEAEAQQRLDLHKQDREKFLQKQKEEPDSEKYFPAGGLPEDSVLVVRTGALLDLQQRLLEQESPKEKALGERAEKSYLNIIGALLEITTGTHGTMMFKSETELRDFLSDKYKGFQGLTLRTLADKFAQAKKSLNDELD